MQLRLKSAYHEANMKQAWSTEVKCLCTKFNYWLCKSERGASVRDWDSLLVLFIILFYCSMRVAHLSSSIPVVTYGIIQNLLVHNGITSHVTLFWFHRHHRIDHIAIAFMLRNSRDKKKSATETSFKQFDLNDVMWKYFSRIFFFFLCKSHKKDENEKKKYAKNRLTQLNFWMQRDTNGFWSNKNRSHSVVFWKRGFRFSMENNRPQEIRSSLIPSIYSVDFCDVQEPRFRYFPSNIAIHKKTYIIIQ